MALCYKENEPAELIAGIDLKIDVEKVIRFQVFEAAITIICF
jgi:hypothetical protein